jgi:hypothetical protein
MNWAGGGRIIKLGDKRLDLQKGPRNKGLS